MPFRQVPHQPLPVNNCSKVGVCNLFVSMLNAMNIETDSFATSSGELKW